MSATTQVIDFSDIYTEILNKMRQPTNITAIQNQAKRYANTALHHMVLGFEYKMPWLERSATLITMGPYTTGTVAVTRGSTTVTGTSTLWTTANSYGVNNARTTGKLSLGDNNIYTISAVGDAGSITTNERYVASADLAAGASYTYFEDEYALASDFLKMIDTHRFTAAYEIPLIGRNEFRLKYTRPNVGGLPKVATILDKGFGATTTPVIYVQFYPYPGANYLIPYSYITNNIAISAAGVAATSMSADTDEPNLPLRYRNAIVMYAISQWYIDKKYDARAQAAQSDYEADVTRIVSDQNIGAATNAKIQPAVSSYTGYARTPYRSSARRFSTNNSFDDFRS